MGSIHSANLRKFLVLPVLQLRSLDILSKTLVVYFTKVVFQSCRVSQQIGCFLAPWTKLLPSPGHVRSNPGSRCGPQNHWNFDKIWTSPQYLSKSQKVSLRSPDTFWKRLQTPPLRHKERKFQETSNLMNTTISIATSRHAAFQRRWLVLTTYLITQIPTPDSRFIHPQSQISQRYLPKSFLRSPQVHPKSIKSRCEPEMCPRAIPVDLWMTEMIIHGARMESPGHQNETLGPQAVL